MVTPFKLRLYMLVFFLLAGFGLLSYRLYEIQINQREHYSRLVPGHKFETIRVPGIRGEIKDRYGVTMVDSTPNYEMRFNLREIVEAYKKIHGEVPRTTYFAKDGDGITRPRGQDDIVEIFNATIKDRLGELGLLADFSASAMEVHYRSNGGLVPFTYRRDLTFHDFARFAERNIGIPGVTVTRTGRRRYLYDSLACHVLGYMSLADLDKVDAEKKREFTYYVGDDYGVHGVEKTMDSYLQGKPGMIKIEKNEKRKFLGIVEQTEPMAGSDVYLTIDARLQYITAMSLREIGRGAAVAIDPNNGDILSIASVPSYNPNNLIPGNVSAADWKRYTEDKYAPLFSRALNPYSPGSTCKIPIALAGCLSDSWKLRFSCGGGKQFGNKFMKCWSSGHGTINLSESIKRSCNGFYYRYSLHTGIDNISQMTRMLGMGRLTGIRVTGEKPGTIPSPEWLRQKGLNWTSSFTALTSIGQGFTEATPLQMASVTATVANGGKVYQPRIVKRVLDREGLLVLDEPPLVKYDLTKEGVTAEQIEIIKRGMWRVVNESGGTAGRAKSPITTISGKTGTAQTGNAKEPTNAWFISFAPYENPEIAVCVFVQNGNSGGAAASPIAKNIIENYFALKKGAEIMKLTKLPEAVGNKKRIMSTSFDNSELVAAYNKTEETPAPAPVPEDDDTGVDITDFVPESMTNRQDTPENYAKPAIRVEADRRGTVRQFNTPRRSSRWNSSGRARRYSN